MTSFTVVKSLYVSAYFHLFLQVLNCKQDVQNQFKVKEGSSLDLSGRNLYCMRDGEGIAVFVG